MDRYFCVLTFYNCFIIKQNGKKNGKMFREYMLTAPCNAMLVSRAAVSAYTYIFYAVVSSRIEWVIAAETDHHVRDIAETGSCERVCQSGIMKHQDFRRAMQSFIRCKTFRFVLEIPRLFLLSAASYVTHICILLLPTFPKLFLRRKVAQSNFNETWMEIGWFQ